LKKRQKYCEKNPEKIKLSLKKWREKNKKSIVLYRKNYYKKKSDIEKIKNKEYRIKNKLKIAQKEKEYREKNKEERLQKRRSYFQKNKHKHAKYVKKRRNNDPTYKLIDNLRNRLRKALRGKNKSKNTFDLIGCSIEELWNHLEKQFAEGMTRENHGRHGWHVDHIKPCSSFNLNKPEQQEKCFHYTNLQPLWAKDNLSKGSNII
jgi:hypothetical protein